MKRFDLVVVGAGPAGCVTAYTAAKLGLKTLLIEKEKLPRYKPCAGGLTIKDINFLKSRKLFERSIIERKFKKIKIFVQNKELTITSKREIIVTTDRSKFDFLLAKKSRKGRCHTQGRRGS